MNFVNMKQLVIDREFVGWRREYFEVDKIDEETIKKAINYDIPVNSDELLYDSFEDTGNDEIMNNYYE